MNTGRLQDLKIRYTVLRNDLISALDKNAYMKGIGICFYLTVMSVSINFAYYFRRFNAKLS